MNGNFFKCYDNIFLRIFFLVKLIIYFNKIKGNGLNGS